MAYQTTITNSGRALLAAALTGETINFCRVTIGSGSSLSPSTLTDLVSPKLNAQISSNERNGYYETLTCVFTNEGVSSGFSMTEIGVFAVDPEDDDAEILYAYILITDGDGGKIPAASAATISRRILLNAYVSTAQDVQATLDTRLIYATVDDLNEHNADPDAHHDILATFQTKTNLLNTETIADADSIPFYDASASAHKKTTWGTLAGILKNAFFPSASGILKGDGSRNISAATAGTDYQSATQKLTAETALADADTVPFYDASASAHRKTTWSNIVSKIRTALIGGVNGLLKANGSGVVTAATAGLDYQQTTNVLPNENTLASDDMIPFYDVSVTNHRSTKWSNILSKIRTEMFGTANGLLKANGSGSISVATAGSDYQKATNGLTAEATLADDDTFPFYDKSAAADRKTTWTNVKAKLKTYFDTLYNKTTVDSALSSTSTNPVQNKVIYNALQSVQTAVFSAGTTAPSNTKLLWIDTTATTGGLKYYNGSAWVYVPVAYKQ